MADGRTHWSSERRARHSAAVRETWARKRRAGDPMPRRRRSLPSIFEECADALSMRARLAENLARDLTDLSRGDDSLIEMAGWSAQLATHCLIAQQALAAVIRDHRSLCR